jgi:phosphatidate cytidylyltransferase
VALCWLDFRSTRPGLLLLPLAVGASLAGAGEMLGMFRRLDRNTAPAAWIVYAGVLLVVLVAGLPIIVWDWRSEPIGELGWLAIGLAMGLVLAFAEELRRFKSAGLATARLSKAIFAITYVGGLVGFLVQLRLLPGRSGAIALASLIVTVKMSDTGQYFVGRAFGRHKLAPRVSPGKTWEGAAGGLVFAIVGAWSTFIVAGHRMTVSAIVMYAVSLAVAGLLGDLAESLLKRDAGVKDSSTWLPGFGGVLDILDSLLLAAPVAYCIWALGWIEMQ